MNMKRVIIVKLLAILGVITYICNLSFASAKQPCLEADRPIGKSLSRGRERKVRGRSRSGCLSP